MREAHDPCMDVVALPPRGEWFADARDGRALRVSWHPEHAMVVLSTWRDGACVASTQLDPLEAARLIGVLADGLAAQVPAALEQVETA